MKAQKKVFIISLAIMVIFVIASAFFEFCINTSFVHSDYVTNLSVGIAGGAFVSSITSIAIYYAYKRKAVYEYWVGIEKYIQQLSVFGLKNFPQGVVIEDIICSIECSITIVDSIIQLQFSYIDLVASNSEISLFKRNSQLKKVLKNISDYYGKINLQLTQIMKINLYKDKCNEMSYEEKARSIVEYNDDISNVDLLIKESKKLQNLLNIKVEHSL